MSGAKLKGWHAEKAKARQLQNLKRGCESPVPANLPEREEGDARDHAAKARQLAALETSGKRGGKVQENFPEPIAEGQARDHAAKARQVEAVKRGNTTRHGESPVVENFSPLAEGKARDHAAKAVGVSARMIDQAENVPAPVAHVEAAGPPRPRCRCA